MTNADVYHALWKPRGQDLSSPLHSAAGGHGWGLGGTHQLLYRGVVSASSDAVMQEEDTGGLS